MDKKTIYWGKCYAAVESPTDDYQLWFFSDRQVLRENRAYLHMQELKAQGYILIEVQLVKNAGESRAEDKLLTEEEAKDLLLVQ